MIEQRVFVSLYLPMSIRDAVVIEAARRSTASGIQVSAAQVMREAVVNALGLPAPVMPRGRPPRPRPCPEARHRVRPTSPPVAA